MKQDFTISDLFDCAITAGKEVARFYVQLSEAFRNYPPAAGLIFWFRRKRFDGSYFVFSATSRL